MLILKFKVQYISWMDISTFQNKKDGNFTQHSIEATLHFVIWKINLKEGTTNVWSKTNTGIKWPLKGTTTEFCRVDANIWLILCPLYQVHLSNSAL